ncbi:hypothetical protein E4631_18030 [Hymenobacter sp. UV11]|uniref:hypothetical protein n=1 Tax=Hymenobacter sp. UV11 TaxID=1849735 RepID=UPI001076AAF8|nr:hypothetical protein [Hymenobacter sp. UV11]TDN40198.1 hypothetical protein A8B98_15040 [Hymenobacter sp. UV11]TFZ64885.1 hypothetical protein E4631_18030 [Hymenobacter sp. UV11]
MPSHTLLRYELTEPAARYTLSPNLELTANGLVSAILGDTYYKFSDRLFLNALVGVHYTFGQL